MGIAGRPKGSKKRASMRHRVSVPMTNDMKIAVVKRVVQIKSEGTAAYIRGLISEDLKKRNGTR